VFGEVGLALLSDLERKREEDEGRRKGGGRSLILRL
jgi:hypothetical protein